MKSPIRSLFCLCLLPLALPCAAQKKPFALTVDNIMRGNELTGYAPRNVYWSPDGKQVYFETKKASDPPRKPYDHFVVNADGSGLRLLTDDEVKNAPPDGGDLSPDKRTTVYDQDGDLFLYDRDTHNRRRLTETDDREYAPQFSPDGKSVLFLRGNNVFSLTLADATLRQLTDIREGTAPPPKPPENANTSQALLKKTERDLFDTIREQAKQREEDEAKRKKDEKRTPFYAPAGQFITGVRPSPDGSYVAITLRESDSGSKNTVVPRYVTESGYADTLTGRTNVGDVQGHERVAVVKCATGESHFLEFTAPEIKAVGVPSGPRHLDWYNFQWSEDGKHAVVMAASDDNKDFWILGVDPATGKTQMLVDKHDDAWVGGPDFFTLGFLPNSRRVYYVSEQTGFAHIYTVPIDGGTPQQLTQGRFEVENVRLSPDKTRFYYASSEGSPADRVLCSLPLDGGTPTRIARLTDADEDGYIVSPDDRNLAIVRSESNRPPELFLLPNKPDPNALGVQVTHSPTPEWLSYPWIRPPIVTFPARDGATVAARLYKPANWKRGGPAVLFIHGAGYLQNVHNWWSHYFREYMFHHLLMERGFLVLDVDYRGSAGYGRDWRTGIYRHMGGKDLDDEVDAAKWLVSQYGVDPKRIGLYGGSYGGFLTLMGMFTAPEVFAAGAALRPVTDWAHYNHGYTSNILNQPQNDPEAYKQSSPIFFAEGLKGALLICHGMVDENVHFQDSVRLAERLIELHKENWELAAFPVEDHAFTQPASWADEYKRILKLFETNLKPHGSGQ